MAAQPCVQILASLHPSGMSPCCLLPRPGWQLPVKALTVSLQSPSSTSVFLVLLWWHNEPLSRSKSVQRRNGSTQVISSE